MHSRRKTIFLWIPVDLLSLGFSRDGHRWEHLICWCEFLSSKPSLVFSLCLTSEKGATKGTLCLNCANKMASCLTLLHMTGVRTLRHPLRSQTGPALIPGRVMISSSGWDASFSASRGADGKMRGEGPFSLRTRGQTSLSSSPESETLHLRSAWWAFKSLKWVFGSVAPQEVAHLSPKWLFF